MRTIQEYDIVILDFDGTICDLTVDWPALKQVVFETFAPSYQWSPPMKLMNMVNAIYASGNMEHRETLLSFIRQFENPQAPVYANVNDKLLGLMDQFYVISNNLNETIYIALHQMGMLSKCKGIIGIDNVQLSKPFIHPFNALCALTKVTTPGSYLMIGDSETDRDFALAAQIDFKHVNTI